MDIFQFITEADIPNSSKLQFLYVVAVTRKEILSREKEGYFFTNRFLRY